VPLVNDVFQSKGYMLANGESFSYAVTPDMLSSELDEGQYRIVTDVWRNEHQDGETVWADFVIDKNAPKQETVTMPADWFGNPHSADNKGKR
jgi:hypothetical protein